MLLVQEYLMTHSFGDLARDHGVYASFSKDAHKWSLNYDQLEAKESDPLAQQCRGLILSRADVLPVPGVVGPDGKIDRSHEVPGPTMVLAYPMDRFFNYGQGAAADIDFNDPELTVLEKLDGTLCIVYYDSTKGPVGEWCVATRSVPEADLPMDNGIFTFRTLFEKAFLDTVGVSFADFSQTLNKAFTYCFELTTPYNRIVVEYKKNGITLLAVRSMLTWLEMNPKTTLLTECLKGVPIVEQHNPKTIKELVEWVSSLNPMEHEGVVIRDGRYRRIKVKNAAYVAYNKVRDALATSPRNMVELILSEKDDDVAPMLPDEIVLNLQKIKKGLQEALREHDDWYKSIRDVMQVTGKDDKKSFALLVQEAIRNQPGLLWQAPFFQMFDGKASNMKDFIAKNRKDGSWGDSFLDKMLELAQKYNP